MKVERSASLVTRAMSPKGALGRHFGLLSAHIKNKEEFEKLKQAAKTKLAADSTWKPPVALQPAEQRKQPNWTAPAVAKPVVSRPAVQPAAPQVATQPTAQPSRFNIGQGAPLQDTSNVSNTNEYNNAVTGLSAASGARASQINGVAGLADLPLSMIPGRLGALANVASPLAAVFGGGSYVGNAERPADIQAAARKAENYTQAAAIPQLMSTAVSSGTAPVLSSAVMPLAKAYQYHAASHQKLDESGNPVVDKNNAPVTERDYSGKEQLALSGGNLAAQGAGLAKAIPAALQTQKTLAAAAAAGKAVGGARKFLSYARAGAPAALVANAGMAGVDALRLAYTDAGRKELDNLNNVQAQASGNQSRAVSTLSGLGNLAGGLIAGDGGQAVMGGARAFDYDGTVREGDVAKARTVQAEERQRGEFEKYKQYFTKQLAGAPPEYVAEIATRAAQRDQMHYAESLRLGRPMYPGKQESAKPGDSYGANVATLSNQLGRSNLSDMMEDPKFGPYLEQLLRTQQLEAPSGYGIDNSAYTRNTRSAK